ncbi:MAG: hypothetical protein GDA48_24695 [Hormoscilla sp. GM102CHS1]|nr:hypothetical protein [Hormoscilla sp. GM102CHS1]
MGGSGNNTLIGGKGADTFVLNPNGFATIRDFEDGIDSIQLEGNWSWSNLEITSHLGNSTSIKVKASGQILAVLSGIDHTLIDASDFVGLR